MKLLVNSIFLLLGCVLLCPSNLYAQDRRKQVTVNITIEADGYRTSIDTTFIVDREEDADRIIDQLIKARYMDQEKMEKVIIIRDAEDREDYHTPKPRKKRKAMMGVYLDTNSSGKGVRITSVTRGGAAEEAGLNRGDLIVEIDGERIKDYHDLVKTKEAYEPGDDMRVIFLRDGDRYNAQLRLQGEDKPSVTFSESHRSHSNSPKAFLGVYTDELSASQARKLGLTSQQGIYLEGIVPYSGAARGGLEKGDVILSIDGRPLDASWELGDALGEHRPGEEITISFIRDGRYRNTRVLLTDRETVKNRKPKKVKVVTEKAFLGVHLENQSSGGVRITGVVDNSSAEAAGLKQNDVIISMDRFTTDTYSDLSEAMKQFEPSQRIRIVFERGGRIRSTTATLGSKSIEKWVEVPGQDDFPPPPPPVNPGLNLDRDNEDMDTERLIRNFSDREKGEQLLEYMENPSLRMDLFDFYPNPNDGRFTLRFKPKRRGDLQIRIYNSEGKEVYLEFIQDFFGEYNKEINISRNAPRGTYFLQLTQGERGMVQRILVK